MPAKPQHITHKAHGSKIAANVFLSKAFMQKGLSNDFRFYLLLLNEAKSRYGYIPNDEKFLLNITKPLVIDNEEEKTISLSTLRRRLDSLLSLDVCSLTNDGKRIHVKSQLRLAVGIAYTQGVKSKEEMYNLGVFAHKLLDIKIFNKLALFNASIWGMDVYWKGTLQEEQRGDVSEFSINIENDAPISIFPSKKEGKKDWRWEERTKIRKKKDGTHVTVNIFSGNYEAFISTTYSEKSLRIWRSTAARYAALLQQQGSLVKYRRKLKLLLKDNCSFEQAKEYIESISKNNVYFTGVLIPTRKENTLYYEMTNTYVFLDSYLHCKMNELKECYMSTSSWEYKPFPLRLRNKRKYFDLK